MSTTPYMAVVARTDELREHHYRLRHKVYCEQLKYEPESPDRMERDEFDSKSVAILAKCVISPQWQGTLRIISPTRGPLPIERIYRRTLGELGVTVNRQNVAEISRCCTISSEGAGKAGMTNMLTLQLFRTAAYHSQMMGFTHWVMLVEPALRRLLRTLNVSTELMNDQPIDHRGWRYPVLISLAAVADASRQLPGDDGLLRVAIPAQAS